MKRAAEGRAPRRPTPEQRESRLGWLFVAPALLAMGAVALLPLGFTFWESLHLHDLRDPGAGRPFVGLMQYARAALDARLGAAALRTLGFAGVSVTLELALGLALALLLHAPFRGRSAARTLSLLPWAVPTVVSALVWRFLFEGPGAAATQLLGALGGTAPVWLGDPLWAWVPLVAADVWKTTPFVSLLLLAGLQSIDPALYEAARVDGAGAWQRFWHVTLPLLRPALVVGGLFRALDALRLFDLAYVLTGGGPGTATEPLALYTFEVLLRDLRFGYGSALSLGVFGFAFALAWAVVRLSGPALLAGKGGAWAR